MQKKACVANWARASADLRGMKCRLSIELGLGHRPVSALEDRALVTPAIIHCVGWLPFVGQATLELEQAHNNWPRARAELIVGFPKFSL